MGVETRMSENILTTMYGVMRTDDESTDVYYVFSEKLNRICR